MEQTVAVDSRDGASERATPPLVAWAWRQKP